MKNIFLLLSIIVLGGCTGTHYEYPFPQSPACYWKAHGICDVDRQSHRRSADGAIAATFVIQ
jgi:hypothetical protein